MAQFGRKWPYLPQARLAIRVAVAALLANLAELTARHGSGRVDFSPVWHSGAFLA